MYDNLLAHDSYEFEALCVTADYAFEDSESKLMFWSLNYTL